MKNTSFHLTYVVIYTIFNYFLVYSYITRLPDCGKYNANFTLYPQDSFVAGSLLKKFQNKTLKDCILSCITATYNCMYINHHYVNNLCRHHKTSTYNFTTSVASGWKFASTNYITVLRGPICTGKNPCLENEICRDDCSVNRYSCVTATVASITVITNPEMTTYTKATDNDLDTYVATNDDVGDYDHFIKIILSEEKHIMVVKTKLYTASKPMVIRIGNEDSSYLNNDICTTAAVEENQNRYYFCDNGFMSGKYIYIHKQDIKIKLRVYEIKVYLLR